MAITTINTKQIRNATIIDEDVDPAAAIAGTKIAADFGAQNLVVDTVVLYVDSTGNNVGVGTAAPSSDSRAFGSMTTTASIFLGVIAGDPASPVEGQIWYNSTDKQFKGRNNTSIVILG